MNDMLDRLSGHDGEMPSHGVGSGQAGRVPVTARLVPRSIVVMRFGDGPITAPAQEMLDRAGGGSGGAALPDDVRARFERSLGADLGGVRVHTGAASAEAAHGIGARAYTTGQDIHFGAGQYQPDDPFGLHLLAHEVVHTVQQGSAPAAAPQAKLEISAPGDAYEVEADALADRMVRGEPAAVATVSPGLARTIMRQSHGGGGGAAPEEAREGDGAGGASGAPAHAPEGAAGSDAGQAPPRDVGPPVAPGSVSVPPPPPLDWSGVAPVPASPDSAWSSAPSYPAHYAGPGNLAAYRDAFGSSWTSAQGAYNTFQAMHETVKQGERDIPPAILRAGPGASVGAEQAQADAGKAFDGGKVKADVANIGKASPEIRKKVMDLRDVKIPNAVAEAENKRGELKSVELDGKNAETDCDTAAADLAITKDDAAITAAGLDINEVKRQLEDQRAILKAAGDSAKALTASFDAYLNPTNVTKAVDATLTAVTSIQDARFVNEANSRLKAIDGHIGRLNAHKNLLQVSNAEATITKARRSLEQAKIKVSNATRSFDSACRTRDGLYRELAEEMKKVGAANGMNAQNQQLLAAAVEAIPKLERIAKYVGDLQDAVGAPPPYSHAAGVGAALATNAGEFQHKLGILKGGKAYLAELHTLWESRVTSVKALIDSSTSVDADW